MLRDHGAHVTLCVMSVQVGLLPMVLPTTQVSDLYLAINNFLVFYLVQAFEYPLLKTEQ
jgi:hypothetical protein